MMNIFIQTQLGKSRSYTACIADANKMFFSNILPIFRHTWIYILFYALFVSLFFSFFLMAPMLYDGDTKAFMGVIFLLLLIVCSRIIYGARVMMLVDGKMMRWNIIRCMKLMLCEMGLVLLLIVLSGIFVYLLTGNTMAFVGYEDIRLFVVVFSSLSVIILLFILPFVYIVMRYFMEPCCRLRDVIKSYRIGLRHWGFIFTTSLITSLLVMVSIILVSIPTLVLLLANSLSVFGVNYIGDPSGLPDYFGTLRFCSIAVSSFICLYINIFTVFVNSFIYGSVKMREKERLNYLNQQKI